LAGGTTLALHLGHRISVDLDFFTQEKLEEKILSVHFNKLPEFKEDGLAWERFQFIESLKEKMKPVGIESLFYSQLNNWFDDIRKS